ncbi:MAG: hypothetical protein E2586_02550 [Novosphingobium sp.]|nr:hypothetical protein [Novosphingobium sp.]
MFNNRRCRREGESAPSPLSGNQHEVIYLHSPPKRIALGLRNLRTKSFENLWRKHDNIPL